MGRQPRQRPISCTLCRVRKLRCSRVFPCSNCTSRGVACQHDGITHEPRAAAAAAAAAAAVAADEPKDVNAGLPKDVSTVDLLSRLEKLEALVASQAKNQGSGQSAVQQAPPPPATEMDHSADFRKQSYPEPPRDASSLASTSTMVSRLQRLTADALWLEASCAGLKLLDCLIADTVTFRTCPIRLISKPSGYLYDQDATPSSFGAAQPVRCIWLPRREEAHILVNKYFGDVGYLPPVVHGPTVTTLIEAAYNALEQDMRVDIGSVMLILSLCTSTTFAWTPFDDARGLFANADEANSQSTAWLKASLDLVDYAHRTAHVSLELLQGMVILFFVLCSYESVSSRARTLQAQAVNMGRELGLHCIDYPSSQAAENAVMNSTKMEMSRRVWWYLASSDWMLAQFSAPLEGSYSVNPRHMAVRRPRNADDDELIDGQEPPDHPMEVPTSVSYFLQRIRLAEVCHSLLDRAQFGVLNPETMDYGQVMEVDAKFQKFMEDLPAFFSIDAAGLQDLPANDRRRGQTITAQRFTLNLLLHRQLCKLHLPYLARGTVEPRFAHSREMCLKSARIIIAMDKELKKERFLLVSLRQRMNIVLRSIFIATIALVLDACLSGERDNVATGDEVARAWIILEEAKDQSPVASKLLELSMQVLKKHQINHPALEAVQNRLAGQVHPNGTPPMTPDSGRRDISKNNMISQQPNAESEAAYLERQWQAMQGRMDLDSIDWDRLFWGLDAPFI